MHKPSRQDQPNFTKTMQILVHQAIYYQIDLVIKAMYSKARHGINLKPEPTILDAGYLILLTNFLDHGQWYVHKKTDHFH